MGQLLTIKRYYSITITFGFLTSTLAYSDVCFHVLIRGLSVLLLAIPARNCLAIAYKR